MNHFPMVDVFLRRYWVEDADIIYGDMCDAIRDFVAAEGKQAASDLRNELAVILDKGLLICDKSNRTLYEIANRRTYANRLTTQEVELIVETLLAAGSA